MSCNSIMVTMHCKTLLDWMLHDFPASRALTTPQLSLLGRM